MVSGPISSGGGELSGSESPKRLQAAALHVAGGVAGGVVAGAAVWFATAFVRGVIPESARIGAAVAICAWAATTDSGFLRVPTGERQVPQGWFRRYGLRRSYMYYGLTLGAVYLTKVNHAFAFAFLAVVGLVLPLPAALLGGACLGLARTVVIVPAAAGWRSSGAWLYGGRVAARSWTGAAAAGSIGMTAALLVTAF